jgi:hypothetical protein
MLSIPAGIPFTPAIKSNFVTCQHESFGFWAAAIGTMAVHTVISSNTVQRSCSFMSPQRRLSIFVFEQITQPEFPLFWTLEWLTVYPRASSLNLNRSSLKNPSGRV